MSITIIMLLLPFFAAPLIAYMFNKSMSFNKISNNIGHKKLKVKKIDIFNNYIIVIHDKNDYYAISFIEISNNYLTDNINDYEIWNKLSKLGKILANTNAETEYRIVKFDVKPEKISKKIKEEINKLKIIKESNEIVLKNIEEKEKELTKIYEYIIKGEKLVFTTSFIVVRKKGKKIEEVVAKVDTITRELANAIEITLGVKTSILKSEALKNILEAKLLLNPEPSHPSIESENNIGKAVPLILEDTYINDYKNGLFLGYIHNTKKPFIINLDKFSKGHFLIVGPTGKGKTTLMTVLIKRMFARGHENFLIIDPKGDMNTLLPSSINLLRINRTSAVDFRHYIEFRKMTNKETKRLSGTESIEDLLIKKAEGKKYITVKELESLENERIVYIDVYDNVLDKISPWIFDYKTTLISMDNLTDIGRELFSFILLKNLQEYMYNRGVNDFSKKWLFIDEAWRLSEASIYYTKRLIKEARGFGITLVLSTQTIQDLPKDLLHNFSNVIVFGSSDFNYIKSVSQLIGYNEEPMRHLLQQLSTGQALFKLMNNKPIMVDIMP